MKKVLLVNTNTEKAPYPVPPIGLGLLAASLETEFDVRIFDGMFRDGHGLRDEIRGFSPDYIGVGIRNIDDVVMGQSTYYLNDIKAEFIDPIREESRATTIYGGCGFSIFPHEILEMFGGDFGIVGEGEQTLLLLLAALENGRDPLGIAGVVAGGHRSRGIDFGFRQEASLKIPESSIDQYIDFGPYRKRGSYPIQTKRGCRYRCIYCSYPSIEGRAYRLRSKEEVASEIEGILKRLGDVSIEFVDSTFNAPVGHGENICREIIERGIEVRLRTMGVNPGRITSELLTLMKRAGFAQIDCTPDSASEAMLVSLRKNFRRKKLEEVAKIIRDQEMPTMWFFIFGGPGETEATIMESFEFIDNYIDDIDMVHITEGLRIFPGTELFERAVAEGIVSSHGSTLHPVFYVSKHLGKERLREIVQSECSRRPNCVPAMESAPSLEMRRRAAELRQKHGLDEPMFRTLLRVRRERMGFGWAPRKN